MLHTCGLNMSPLYCCQPRVIVTPTFITLHQRPTKRPISHCQKRESLTSVYVTRRQAQLALVEVCAPYSSIALLTAGFQYKLSSLIAHIRYILTVQYYYGSRNHRIWVCTSRTADADLEAPKMDTTRLCRHPQYIHPVPTKSMLNQSVLSYLLIKLDQF